MITISDDDFVAFGQPLFDTRVSGDKAYCEFHRIAKLKSGEVQDFLSIDVLTFRDGLIIHKDTYYKNRTS